MTIIAIEATNFPPLVDGFEMIDTQGNHWGYARIGKDGKVFGFDTVQAANGKVRRWNRQLEELGDGGFFYPVYELEGYTIEYVGDEFGWCSPMDCENGVKEWHWVRHGHGHSVTIKYSPSGW